MADRNFARDAGALEKGLVKLFAHIRFGATGAPTIVRAKGIAEVTRDSQGKFTVRLQDRYQRLLAASGVFLLETGTPAAPIVHAVSDASHDGTPAVVVQTGASSDGAATDPANGEELLLELTFSNSIAL